MIDYYETLGVGPDATDNEIRKGYRARANRWHPDKWCADPEADRKTAEMRFRQVREAYDHLIDEEKRRAYDRKRATQQPRPPTTSSDAEDPSQAVSYAANVARELKQAIENAADAENDHRREYWKIKQASWERTLDPIIAMLHKMHGPDPAEPPTAVAPRPTRPTRRRRRRRRARWLIVAAVALVAVLLAVVLLVALGRSA